MELNSDCGLSILGVSTVEEVALSEVVSGEEENLADCNPLLTIIPPGWTCRWKCTTIMRC